MTSCDALLTELAPAAERLMERHLASSKTWYPHETVPWGLGRDYEEGRAWDPAEFPLPDAVRSALFVNLLTEDNLPYYSATIAGRTAATPGAHEVYRAWVQRWTAEEGRHSIAIRDYLTVTRAIDPVELEDARMAQVSGGVVPVPPSAIDTYVYTSLQELATRIAHRNTGKLLEEVAGAHPAARSGYETMARVASDENFHFLFYRDMVSAALEIDPSTVVHAVERQVTNFQMPGTGIKGFARHAIHIARAGVFGIEHLYEQIVQPLVMRLWRLPALERLTPEAEAARDRVIAHIEGLGRTVAKRAARRERTALEPDGAALALA